MWADSGGRAGPHHARRITHRKWQRAHGNGCAGIYGKAYLRKQHVHCPVSGYQRRSGAAVLGLSAGGKIEMPLQDMFWGSYFGSFTDKFGVQWMVDHGTELK